MIIRVFRQLKLLKKAIQGFNVMGKRGPLPKSKLPVVDYPSTCAPAKRSKEDEARERRYRAEDGLRTLNQAEEIRSDKQRMGDIQALASEQMKSLKKFAK